MPAVQTTDEDWSEADSFDIWIRDASCEVYVRPGADGRSGNNSPCFMRIQDAIAAAPAGAAIRVAGASYAENVVIDRPVILEPGRNDAFTAPSPSGPVVIAGPGF